MTIPEFPAFPSPPVAVRKRKVWPWVVAITCAGIVASAAVVVVVLRGNSASPCADSAETIPCPGPDGTWISADGTVRSDLGPATETAPAAPLPVYTAPTYPTAEPPSGDKFSLDLKTISKQCFGSAGCDIVVEPKLNYSGSGTDLDQFTCDITYSITGDNSGEIVETARGNGGTSFQIQDSVIMTRSSKTKITAKVTEVSCR